jgi:hypothetical protein
MPVMMVMRWDGVTPAQYDAVRAAVDWEGNPPTGGQFHVAAFDGQALRVTDLWESGEDFQHFVHGRLMAGVAQAGIHGEPQVEIVPVHHISPITYTPNQAG